MPRPLVPAHTKIVNHFNKETFVFTDPMESEALAKFDVVLEKGGSGGGNAIAHIHPKADEYFHVRKGRLMIMIDGIEHVADAGETVMVPRGKAHFFRNAHDGETHATVSFTPGQKHLRFFLNLAASTVLTPENFSPAGDPKLLPIALKLNAYRDHLYIAGPPIWVQKLIYAALAPIAWLMGYRLIVAPNDSRLDKPDVLKVATGMP
ncbi:cupin domain-containing protein [Rhizobium terrae]|uniref:cupin domain-containing protein n=1 Tax=Rhizobium terrae TaxID=2171756 RepID=UPI000E3D391B|nr:cupin domain-containing protein [Rhizobium terrae]